VSAALCPWLLTHKREREREEEREGGRQRERERERRVLIHVGVLVCAQNTVENTFHCIF
jgi:hypothetical protein